VGVGAVVGDDVLDVADGVGVGAVAVVRVAAGAVADAPLADVSSAREHPDIATAASRTDVQPTTTRALPDVPASRMDLRLSFARTTVTQVLGPARTARGACR
jgi:hypothetical protein